MRLLSYARAAATVVSLCLFASGLTAAFADDGNAAPAIDKAWLHPYFRAGVLAKAAERYRLDDYAGAVPLWQAAIDKLPSVNVERLPARFLLALSKMNNGQWQAAALDFKALSADYPLLADYHAYYAARCDLRAGNNTEALTWARKVSPGAVSEAEAQLIELEALERLAEWEQLEASAHAFLQKFESGPRRAEARFRLATAMENRQRPAADIIANYRLIWSQAPTESWAKQAQERIAAVATAANKPALATPSPEQWLERANALADKQQNAEAEAAFSLALSAGLSDAKLVCEAKFNRGQAVFKQRQRPRAAPFYEEAEAACRAAGVTELTVKSLYQGARCRSSGGDRTTAVARYAQLEKEFPQASFADDARLRAAEVLQDGGDTAGARALLSEMAKLYPNGDMLGEALFRLAFAAYDEKDWDKAHHWLDENLRLIPRETMWFAEGRALYWKARVYARQGNKARSVQMYEEAIRQYPLSYYALVSFERLRESFPKVRAQLLGELHSHQGDETWPVAFGRSAAYAAPEFIRAVELARLGLGADARRELAKVNLDGDAAKEGVSLRERALWLTSVLLDRGRVWNTSHAVPRYTLTEYKRTYPKGANAAAWRLSYPRAYPEYVATNSKANNVPPFLQLSIMREESAFSPTIESFANAIGLTQMLVSTAQGYSDKKVTRETLLDPASNIMLGSRFLGHLLEHFGRAVALAIPGYNAGEIAVERWLKERGNRPLDEFVELIPYDETRGYTKRVLASYLTYSWLYGAVEPVPKLSFSLQRALPKPAPKPTKAKPRKRT